MWESDFKSKSQETCAQLLFMLLQDFFVSARPHRVHKIFLRFLVTHEKINSPNDLS